MGPGAATGGKGEGPLTTTETRAQIRQLAADLPFWSVTLESERTLPSVRRGFTLAEAEELAGTIRVEGWRVSVGLEFLRWEGEG